MIKKHSLIITIFLFLLPNSSLAQTATACGHPFYPPISWVANNQLIGLAPDITQRIFSTMNISIEFIADYNWKRCLQEAKEGNIDIVVAAYNIPERQKHLLFTDQYIIEDPIGVFTHKNNNENISAINDLKGKTVGLLLGDSFGEKADKFLAQNSNIEYVSNNQQNFQKLSLKRIDYMPIGLLSGSLQSKKLNVEEKTKPTELTLGSEFYYLAISKKSHLQDKIFYASKIIEEMKENGLIEKLKLDYSEIYLKP